MIKHQIAAEKALSEGLIAQTKISNQRAFRDFDIFDDTYGSFFEMLSDLHDLEDFKFKISRDERTFRNTYQEEYRDIVSTLNLTSGFDYLGAVFDESYAKQSIQDHLLPVEGSILSMRPENGHITAIVGGSGFKSDNQQIRSFQAYRQPGSSFKPLVYATSIDFFGKNPTPGKNITAATQFADIGDVAAVPFIGDRGREGYKTFLTKQYPRAFVISPSGRWAWAEMGDDPLKRAQDTCQKNNDKACRPYAVDDQVVWVKD